MSPNVDVRVGSTWLSALGGFSDLEVTHGRNGPLAASWSMALRNNQRHPALVRSAPVQVYSGPVCVWSGTLAEPDQDSKTFTAIGVAREGESAQPLAAGGLVTTKPNTAIDQAAVRGVVSWTRVDDFGDTDLAGAEGGTGTDDPNIDNLTALLDWWADENDSQWRVTPDRRLVISPEDETAPADWLILPGAGVLGVADDDVTDRVFLRYQSSTAGQLRTASYPATTPEGGIERKASIVHLGAMTSARATSIAEGMWRRLSRGRTGWTNGIEVTEGQVITQGGQVARLAQMRAGQTIRLLDLADPRGVDRNLDVVLGETVWKPGERTIQLNPVGLVARTWEQVMEDTNAKGDA